MFEAQTWASKEKKKKYFFQTSPSDAMHSWRTLMKMDMYETRGRLSQKRTVAGREKNNAQSAEGNFIYLFASASGLCLKLWHQEILLMFIYQTWVLG